MGNPRPRPRLLPEKLLAIREFLNVDKADMTTKLQSQLLSHCGRQFQIQPARISEYENGQREPNLFVLIAYIRLGQIHMESLVDDDITGAKFRTLLGKQLCFLTFSNRPQKQKRNKPVTH
jgi:hypothetical protein